MHLELRIIRTPTFFTNFEKFTQLSLRFLLPEGDVSCVSLRSPGNVYGLLLGVAGVGDGLLGREGRYGVSNTCLTHG